MDELRALTSATKPSFVCVTETWFTPDIEQELIEISGYCLFRCDRRDNASDWRRGGGTIIYASSSVSPTAVSLPSCLHKPFGFDFSLIGFSDPHMCFLLCVYIPPNLNVEIVSSIKSYLTDALDHLLSLSPNAAIYVCGDFNKYDCTFLTHQFNLTNIVDFPTFGNNILDKFFCEEGNQNLFTAFPAPPLGSANNLHKVIFISRNMQSLANSSTLQKVYDFRKSNIESFRTCIGSVNWSSSSFYELKTVEESVQAFYDEFQRAMSVIPVSFVKLGPRTKPWVTPVLLDLINKRWRAYRKNDFTLFNHYKRKVKLELIKSKKIWSDKMCKSSRGIWNVVRDIRNKNEHDSATKIVSLFSNVDNAAESLNRLFSETFVQSCSVPMIQTARSLNSALCDHNFVLSLFKNLRTDKACGSDQIPPSLLKIAAPYICHPVSYIFNKSFETSNVPDIWKLADVCPIPKCMPVDVNQLRPISLLPVLAKLLEKTVYVKYRTHLFLSYDDAQFAYRPFSSTVCALVSIQDTVLRIMDNCKTAGAYVITLDMSRAFDRIPHHILLHRLMNFDFPEHDMFVNWINSYLSNRKQRVRLLSAVSSTLDVSSGVPQGSVLGPHLFAIFLSTYRALFEDTGLIKYADDVTLVIPVYKAHSNCTAHVLPEIDHFYAWCQMNGMSVNVSKSKYMNVHFGKSIPPPVPGLSNVTSLKILGVIFNEKMTWSDHFDYVCKKVSRRLYVLRVLKPLLSHDQLVNVFYAIIRSLLEYAGPVFLNPGVGLNNKFVSLCRRAFYIIHGRECKKCDRCNLLNVQSRREFLSLHLFTEALNNPDHSLHPLLPKRSNRSLSDRRLILPHVRCSRRLKSFVLSCTMLYNCSI